jgi:hypothetical protein
MFEEDLVDQKKEEEEAQMVGKIKLNISILAKTIIIGPFVSRDRLSVNRLCDHPSQTQ